MHFLRCDLRTRTKQWGIGGRRWHFSVDLDIVILVQDEASSWIGSPVKASRVRVDLMGRIAGRKTHSERSF